MKKLSILFLSLIATASIFTGCSKEEETPAPPVTTDLEIIVKDLSVSESPVLEGATVSIYASEADWLSNKNGKVLTTDVNGKAKFTNLKNVIYYIDVEKGCKNNGVAGFVQKTEAALQTGANTLNVPVVSTAKVNFVNTSANEWDVHMIVSGQDDIIFYTIPANKSGKALMPAGKYTIKMVEFVNNEPTGTTKEFPVDMTCGDDNVTVTVP